MTDNIASINLVNNIMTCADSHDWEDIQKTFADTVHLDFTSLSGGEPMTQSGKEIADMWAGYLPGYENTLHKLFNYQVTQDGDIVKVHAQGRAIHVIKDAQGGDVWIVEGNYDFEITDGRVSLMRFNLEKQLGNQKLPEVAMQRASS